MAERGAMCKEIVMFSPQKGEGRGVRENEGCNVLGHSARLCCVMGRRWRDCGHDVAPNNMKVSGAVCKDTFETHDFNPKPLC